MNDSYNDLFEFIKTSAKYKNDKGDYLSIIDLVDFEKIFDRDTLSFTKDIFIEPYFDKSQQPLSIVRGAKEIIFYRNPSIRDLSFLSAYFKKPPLSKTGMN